MKGGSGGSKKLEEVMRIMIVAIGLAAVGVAGLAGPAGAAKSKMGCEIGSEVWNASAGKCEPGKPKYTKKSSTKSVKKAPAKK